MRWIALLLCLWVYACRAEKVVREEADSVVLTGAGATFQYPLQSKWGAEFNARDPLVKVNYQSIGSGGGIRQLIAGTVHFGATDSPMTDEQLQEIGEPVLHIPVTLGAVAVVTNLPDVSQTIRMPARTLADIFLGKVRRWNDSALASVNPAIALPDREIAVVHRSDGSGTTFIFADYLAKVSEEWKTTVGVSTSLAWPLGFGAKGNEGVAGLVRQTPGAIGYVELTYALQNKLSVAAVENAVGEYVIPTIESVTAAAATFMDNLPEDLRFLVTNPKGKGAYPISGFSFVVVRQHQKDCKVASALARYLWWAVHEGQAFAPPLHYAPLPENLVRKCEEKLRQISCNGRPVLQ